MKEDNTKENKVVDKDKENSVGRYIETKNYISLETKNGRIYWRSPGYKNFV